MASVRKIVGALLDNLTMLLLAFALALFVWVTAVRQANPLQQRNYQLPVTQLARPDGILMNEPIAQVEIRVEAPESVLGELTVGDFTAVIDLGSISFGRSQIPIQIQYDTRRWSQVRLVAQFPEATEVELDQRVTKEIPVVVEVQGEPAPTHRIAGAVVVEPSAISVTGPASLVNPLAEARASVLLVNARETRSVTRPLIFYDRQGSVVGVNTLDPQLSTAQAVITVPIEQRAGVADVAIQVDWIGRPAENYRFLSAIATPRSVLVSGPPDLLANLRTIRTEPIDVSGLRDSATFRVGLVLPTGIVRTDAAPIVVEVDIEPILTTDVVTAIPRIVGLRQTYTATLNIETVAVVLFGPLEALNALMPEDVRVDIDVFGYGPGEHQIEPTVDVSMQLIEVREIRPSLVTVVITTTLPPEGSSRIPITLSAVPSAAAPAGAAQPAAPLPIASVAWLPAPPRAAREHTP